MAHKPDFISAAFNAVAAIAFVALAASKGLPINTPREIGFALGSLFFCRRSYRAWKKVEESPSIAKDSGSDRNTPRMKI